MRFHWLQNVAFEDAANIGVWAAQRGHAVTNTRLHEGQSLPEIEAIDALAVMGGPMNVYQHRDYPWLMEEKRFIEQALRADIPIIGVCLGAQLIADVLGATVVQNPEIEIGWFEMQLTTAAKTQNVAALPNDMPEHFMALSWHGDTFEIPSGATHVAQSEACRNQAFAYGRHILGLQCHLEYSAESIERMLAHCGHELVHGRFIQSREQIRAGLAHVEKTRGLLFSLLHSLIERV
jgi:GMP synthase-like glutamine amidotransferase